MDNELGSLIHVTLDNYINIANYANRCADNNDPVRSWDYFFWDEALLIVLNG